jgi:hypothetical protein
MIDFETHSCDACGEQFIVACDSQLTEQLKKHKRCCRGRTIVNKKRERTQQFQQRRIALYVHDTTINRIEEHNFDKLVKQGVLVNG